MLKYSIDTVEIKNTNYENSNLNNFNKSYFISSGVTDKNQGNKISQSGIVNYNFISNDAINSSESAKFYSTPPKNNIYTNEENNNEIVKNENFEEDKSQLNDTSQSYPDINDTKRTFNETNEDKKIKFGIISHILLCLILTNMGFAASSFFIIDAWDIENKQIYNPKCISQAFLQNFFDLSAICLTTIISLLMRSSQRYIILKKLRSYYKWYISYSVIAPLSLSFG